MASANTNRNRCAICNKEKATLRCGGCSRDFCFSHVTDHRQELCKQLDELEVKRDLFRETLTDKTSQPHTHPLVQQIDRWECESIIKIKQAADEARQQLFQFNTIYFTKLERQLNELTGQLRKSREEDDFFETDLSRWQKELTELAETLAKPSNLNIRQTSAPFVTKIVVDIQNEEERQIKNRQVTFDQFLGKAPQSTTDHESTKTRPTSPKRLSSGRLSRLSVDFNDSDDDDDNYPGYYSGAKRDIFEYRSNYPTVRSVSRITDNYDFYTNKISSHPDGDFIDNIHKKWFGQYRKLEHHHGYIQWLFPLQEKSDNWSAEPLQKHEIESIKKDKLALRRILLSYKLMLDFYGFELVDEKTGKIRRSKGDGYRERFRNLNTSSHNYLCITRILKCLGEFDYEYLKFPFLEAILREAIIENTLENCLHACKDDWIETLRSQEERRAIRQYARELMKYRKEGISPPKSHDAIRPTSSSLSTKDE